MVTVHGSAGNLGNCCGCIPARIGIIILCLTYIFFSSISLIYLGIRAIIYALEPRLNHQNCHLGQFGCEAQTQSFFEVFSCDATKSFTLNANEWLFIFGGLFFGITGLSGVVERDKTKLQLFGYFLSAQFVIGFLSLVIDGTYTQVCGSFPDSWWSMVYAIIPKKLDTIKLMGYNPEAMPIDELEKILRLELVEWIVVLLIIGLILVSYFDYEVHSLCSVLEGGPTGLGPAFGIDCAGTATREWNQALRKAAEGVSHEDMDPGDFHAFTNLRHAEKFPFLMEKHPAVNYKYGAIGERLDV